MADNFSYALIYGLDGIEGKGYETPEIIEGILDYMTGVYLCPVCSNPAIVIISCPEVRK